MRRDAFWRPTYKTKVIINGRQQSAPLHIYQRKMNECPRSFITPQSKRLVEIILEGQSLHEETGATLFGPDSSHWDPRFYHAVSILAEEQQRVIEANDELQSMTG